MGVSYERGTSVKEVRGTHETLLRPATAPILDFWRDSSVRESTLIEDGRENNMLTCPLAWAGKRQRANFPRVQNAGFRAQGSEFKVQGSKFWVLV